MQVPTRQWEVLEGRACAGKGDLWPGLAHAWGSRFMLPHEVARKGPSSARFVATSRNTCGLPHGHQPPIKMREAGQAAAPSRAPGRHAGQAAAPSRAPGRQAESTLTTSATHWTQQAWTGLGEQEHRSPAALTASRRPHRHARPDVLDDGHEGVLLDAENHQPQALVHGLAAAGEYRAAELLPQPPVGLLPHQAPTSPYMCMMEQNCPVLWGSSMAIPQACTEDRQHLKWAALNNSCAETTCWLPLIHATPHRFTAKDNLSKVTLIPRQYMREAIVKTNITRHLPTHHALPWDGRVDESSAQALGVQGAEQRALSAHVSQWPGHALCQLRL